MKLRVLSNYNEPTGTIEIGKDGMLKVEAPTPEQRQSLEDLAMHYAAWWVGEHDGKEPTPKQVLETMLERMPEGHRTCCEEVK